MKKKAVILSFFIPFLSLLFPLNTVFADTWWTGSGSNTWDVNYSTQNVGIGTTSPTGVLQINGVRKTADNQGQLLIVGAADHAYLQIKTTNSGTKETGIQIVGTGSIATPDWNIKESANNPTLKFNYRGTDNIAFKSNGDVGLGINDPDATLHVFSGSSAGLTGGGYLILGDHTSYNIVLDANELSARNGEASSPLYIQALSTSANTIINQNTGNVGVGLTAPEGKLHVYSTTAVDGWKGRGVFSGPINAVVLGEGGGIATIGGHDDTLSTWSDLAINPDPEDGNVGIGTTNPTSKLQVNGDFKAQWIHATDAGFHTFAGRVGINTTTDNVNYNLLVNGKIRAKEIVVDTGWSDFVFDSNYQLKSLTEVEQYIDENKHLPDIPSAQEVEENGISLGGMDAKLLQKIEELTLYTIDLKKENEDLKNRLDLLEQK